VPKIRRNMPVAWPASVWVASKTPASMSNTAPLE
jgi:hypothetical protein